MDPRGAFKVNAWVREDSRIELQLGLLLAVILPAHAERGEDCLSDGLLTCACTLLSALTR